VRYMRGPSDFFVRRYLRCGIGGAAPRRSTDGVPSLAARPSLQVVTSKPTSTSSEALALGMPILDLSSRQLLLGLPLTFGLYFVGTVLPAMIFIYAILIPRYLKLTQSMVATVILGGLTYTLMHVWDAWTLFTSPDRAALSVVFLLFTYFGPGMMKAVLTLRTRNAWVHVWAYGRFCPAHPSRHSAHQARVPDQVTFRPGDE
jgi:hypothetical protein